MSFIFDNRPSESPFVEGIYHTYSAKQPGSFISQAESRWEMVITRHQGKTTLSVRGPETLASSAAIPEDAEFTGIIFRLGTFMPDLPFNNLLNGGIHLPAASNSFTLLGSAWEIPTFENADSFIQRLVRGGMIAYEPLVEQSMQGHIRDLSLRSVQRRFLRATGLTYTTVYQIKRAQQALALLVQGVSILDVVERAGYADQPHLTRALRRYIGRTPAQIARLHQFQLTGDQLYVPEYQDAV